MQLGQVEVGTRTSSEQLLGVVEEEQSEVYEPARRRDAIDQDVMLGEMPPARPHQERGQALVAKGVRFASRGIFEPKGSSDGLK